MKKISILGLHLGYGGVEQAIVNQANMLCEDYEVELVIIYKIQNDSAFYINPKVKVIYLTDLKPNRKEFMESLKNKKIFRVFKEGLKSINILYNKRNKMKNYIKNADADILISSRVEITELLNKYSPKKTITIAEEHCHHNNNQKYIKRLKDACNNIDYLILVSKELTNFYKKEIPNTNCIYIPNSLDYLPNKLSKLNNKNFISVGRLSPEKGFCDLIDVFKIINDQDKGFHLDIIGDGNEMGKIKNKINQYNLNNYITMHGFQNKDYINEKLEGSSVYLMCSFEESFGIVLIEAGSFGIPAIAFDSAQGAHEIIKNDKSGYLIKNRNKEKMAEKAIELINDTKKKKLFGKEAKLIAEEFSFENVKVQWLNFLTKVGK